MNGDTYKNAEDYYKSVFEKAGGSIAFYPDKSGAVPTAEMYHREVSEISVQSVKDFCKKSGITEMYFSLQHLDLHLENIISKRTLFSQRFTMEEMIRDFPIQSVCL